VTWKDLSELHIASVDSGDDTFFDTVMKGKIAEAIWKIDTRNNAATSATPLGKGAGVAASEDMGEPAPPDYLVRNCVEKGHPTYIYGGRGTLKSMNALAIGIAIASPEVTEILGYKVEAHGPVVLFDSELNANVFNSRAVALCNGLGIAKPPDLYYMPAVGVPPQQSFPKLHEFAEIIKAKAVVVDSFGFAVRGDPESYRDVRNNSTEYVDPLIAKGVAVVLVEHKPHQGNHIFGSVAKEYHGRYIFRVEDLDGSDRVHGERNTRLINEKASFTDEGQKTTLVTRFSDDKIVIESQGVPDAPEEAPDLSPEVKVRRSLMVSEKTTEELSKDTNLSYDYLRNKVLPPMRDRKEIFKVGTRGKGSAIVWGLNPPDDAATSATLPRGVARVAASEKVVSDPKGLHDLADEISSNTVVALDLETMPSPGWIWEVAAEYRAWRKKLKNKPKPERQQAQWDKFKDKVYKKHATNTDVAIPRVMSLATPGETGVNVLVDLAAVAPEVLLDALKDKTLVTHNGAFDLGVLRSRHGYVHEGKVLDTQLLYTLHHYAAGKDRSKASNGVWRLPDPRDTRVDLYSTGKKDVGMTALAHVAHEHLGVLMDKESQKSDWSAPRLSAKQVRYALTDTSVLLELGDVLIDKLCNIGMSEIVDLESRAFTATVDMSLNGFPADKSVALKMAERYKAESEAALKEVEDLLPPGPSSDGRPWNLNVAPHVREVLGILGANLDKKTYPKTEKTGEPSTTADALRTIKMPEPARRLVEAYLRYKALEKHHRDFARQYAGLIREDGTIKGSFDTVSTGRLSCRKPNLQQVPSRGEYQREEDMRIRSIFRPREDDKFIVADFSQVELLIAGTVAARETGKRGHMLEVFQRGEIDIHTATAASLAGKPPEEVTKAERTLAKAVNFALIYGAQAPALREYARNNYGVEMTQIAAEAYREAFFERYPELEAWHKLVEAECRRGVEISSTPMGRVRKLPKWMSSGEVAHTTAKNSPVQGAGADAIKLTMARLFEDRKNCPGNPRLNASVHDEVVLSVEAEHAEEAAEWVRAHMAAAEREAVGDPESPVVVDVEVRESWA
jgi:DNA polymerase-1